jgi:hypothetical protein
MRGHNPRSDTPCNPRHNPISLSGGLPIHLSAYRPAGDLVWSMVFDPMATIGAAVIDPPCMSGDTGVDSGSG